MKLLLKNLPVGSLPYENINLTTNMMVKLYEQSPFLAYLPNVNSGDNIIDITFNNSNYFKITDNQIGYDIDLDNVNKNLTALQKILRTPNDNNLEEFSFESVFFDRYMKIINRIKPKETVITMLGPLSALSYIKNHEKTELLTNKDARKFIIQYFTLKALYLITKINKISPETKVIIIYDEPALKTFSKLKLLEERIDNSTIIAIYKKIFKKIQDLGGLVGIQCFGKCNWTLAIDSNVNIISFDAYNNPNNLNIIASQINTFLNNEGYINWGFVPVDNERQIKSMNADKILHKFINTTNGLIKAGVSADLLFSHSLISTLGDMSDLPVIFAEKAIIIANQLSKKISTLK